MFVTIFFIIIIPIVKSKVNVAGEYNGVSLPIVGKLVTRLPFSSTCIANTEFNVKFLILFVSSYASTIASIKNTSDINMTIKIMQLNTIDTFFTLFLDLSIISFLS